MVSNYSFSFSPFFSGSFKASVFGLFCDCIEATSDEGCEKPEESSQGNFGSVGDKGSIGAFSSTDDLIFGCDLIVFSFKVDVTSVVGLLEFHSFVADGGFLFVEDGDDVIDGADFLLVFSDDFDALGVGVPVSDVLELTEILPDSFKGSENLDVELELDHWFIFW